MGPGGPGLRALLVLGALWAAWGAPGAGAARLRQFFVAAQHLGWSYRPAERRHQARRPHEPPTPSCAAPSADVQDLLSSPSFYPHSLSRSP